MRHHRRPAPQTVLLCLAAALLPGSVRAAPIRLKAAEFDPSAGTHTQSMPQDDCWLVQFGHSPGPADRALIERTGAKIAGYVPEDCYLVRAKGSAAGALHSLPGVVWAGAYLAEYRIDPGIPADDTPVVATILTFPESGIEAILHAVGPTAVELIRSSTQAEGGAAIIATTGRTAHLLARLPGVRWIEPRISPRLLNDVARGLMGADLAWQDAHLYGNGQTICVADTGIDVGAASPSLHPDFQGRLAAAFALGRPGLTNDPHGHGTHVSGTVLGAGRQSGSNPSAHSYSGSFAGVAPEARLVMQSILDASGGLGGLPADLNDLFLQAYAAGARIHTNSWGAATAGIYEATSAQVDRFTWDHPDMTILFAAGNEGVDANSNGVIDNGSLNSPASAKNAIAVGATESLRASGGYQFIWATGAWASRYPAEPIKSDFMSDDPGGMAAFSSRGPCADGRIKPDVTAPGTNVISCRSRDSSAGTLWGAYSADYCYSGGTSMATPAAAGAAALVREYYEQVAGISPSGALVKATLMVTAKDLTPGQYGAGAFREISARPNSTEGWGLINLKAALAPDTPAACYFVDEKPGITTGQQRSYTVTVVNPAVPLRVLAVWTDYPGDPSAAKALVNDLDLTVQAPDSSIRNGNYSLDRVNNAEGVDIAAPLAGSYTIKVSGFKVPQGPQPFALVVEGGLPRSHISGRVKSSRGSDVPGVTITAAAIEAFTAQTGSDGRYVLSVPAGTYAVTAARPGWSFSVLPDLLDVPESGTPGVDFTGSAPPAAISGTVRFAARETLTQTWESAHPYLNNTNHTVVIAGPADAVRLRAHFARIDAESGFDYVRVRSGDGGVVATYSGPLTDLWSPWVAGNALQVNLTSDVSVTGYGWQVDRCELDRPGDPAAGVLVSDARSGLDVTTGPGGVFIFSGLEPLPTHLTAGAEGMVLYPSRLDVSPEPGETVGSQVFVAVPETPVVHLDIAHTYIGDLTVTMGVGNPASPIWSQIVSARQGAGSDRLLLDIALDDALQYYPPSATYPWYVSACDEAMYDTGSIQAFRVSKGGWTYSALDLPAPIADLGCAVVTIPGGVPLSVGEAKQLADGVTVLLGARVVSAVFGDRFYLQDPQPAAGIAVWGITAAHAGDVVTVRGVMGTIGCERVIQSAQIAVNRPGLPPPDPLNLIGRVLGGVPSGQFTPGFPDSVDLSNVGLLVGLTGWVTGVGADFFYVSDGSQQDDLSGYPGVRVASDGLAAPPAGAVVTVYGVSGCRDAGFGPARVIYPRSNADIIQRNPAP